MSSFTKKPRQTYRQSGYYEFSKFQPGLVHGFPIGSHNLDYQFIYGMTLNGKWLPWTFFKLEQNSTMFGFISNHLSVRDLMEFNKLSVWIQDWLESTVACRWLLFFNLFMLRESSLILAKWATKEKTLSTNENVFFYQPAIAHACDFHNCSQWIDCSCITCRTRALSDQR